MGNRFGDAVSRASALSHRLRERPPRNRRPRQRPQRRAGVASASRRGAMRKTPRRAAARAFAPAAPRPAPARYRRRAGARPPRRAPIREVAARRATCRSSAHRRARASASSTSSAVDRARFAPRSAQHVEAHDVARAFPDRVQRRLAVQPRQTRFPRRSRCRRALPIASATTHRRAFAQPVLERRRRESRQRRFRLAGVRLERARQPQRRHDGGFGFDREVGEHVLHQRLLGQSGLPNARRWRA